MLLLLKVRVVSENIEPLDLEGDVFRDPRLKARELLPTVGIPAFDGSLDFYLYLLFERLNKNARNVLGVRFTV